ncbi:MAG: proline dehydrogenase family protein [Nitrososphaerota archaeon]|nr:proline dehydrogenase family protein [Nitrososphaerota archaeon]MDG6941618.1 proline dehydrogenase family protein [Nitrososphaerota archaeon]MDG6947206.1 proline dehydrogenase family protein [Nitrososphaerota archaeon]MDG6951214.1 proline dehydrogenase family protein [Nitrososphaerota archaeon]
MGVKEKVVLPLAKRWISGPDLSAAIDDAKKANSRGIGAVVNFLGEEIMDPTAADAQVEEYLRLQAALADGGIRGFASVKLTQLGMGSDDEAMRNRFDKIAANAEKTSQLLWIDMEGSKFTEKTVATYLDAHDHHRSLGVAIQAYARRSEADVDAILNRGGMVRLVKGAYREGSDFAFPTKPEINKNFERLMTALFERGDGFAIATHDGALIERAKVLAESSHAKFRFELLKGIRDDLKVDLVKSGYAVSEYLPYGDRWWAYSKRRISEHPSNVWLLLRSMV